MKLKDFKQKTKYREVEITSSKYGELQPVGDNKTSGFCQSGDFGIVAIYPSRKSLSLKVNEMLFDIEDASVNITYFHDYKDETTTFKIENNKHSFSINYKAWWADREDFIANPYAASCEEENATEDIWGYIDNLFEFKNKANNLHSLWAKNVSI